MFFSKNFKIYINIPQKNEKTKIYERAGPSCKKNFPVTKWGKICFFSKKCFGPKTVPKGPFGVGINPIGPKNPRESESGLKNPQTIEKMKNVFFF